VIITREQLNTIVTTGDFGALVGASETAWLECKGQPYQLDNDAAKRELAKDASSFANASGGRILIGVRTKSSTTHFGDEIEEIRPLPQTLVKVTQYVDVVEAWVYPAIQGLAVTWIPMKGDVQKGVVVIDIPPQKAASKPYLVVKTFDGAKYSETLLGYAERKGDTSKPLGVAELQAALRAGLNYDAVMNTRFEALETLIKASPTSSPPIPEMKIAEETIKQRIETAEAQDQLGKQRHIVLAAVPTPPNSLKTIFVSSDESIKRQLEHPPHFRERGWDLAHFGYAKIIKGEFVRVGVTDIKVVDLYRDGMMIAAALADANFLAWSQHEKQRLNPLALIEFISSFLNLYDRVLKDFSFKPSTITIRVELRHMHHGETRTKLAPYGLDNMSQQFGMHEQSAPADIGSFEITAPANDFDPLSVVFDVVKEIYLWFGIEEDKIPYFKVEAGKHRLDTAAILGI
jgi:hypothetical protein